MEIKICSIKMLKSKLSQLDEKKTAAILCTSYSVEKNDFTQLKSVALFEFDDVVIPSVKTAFKPEIAEEMKKWFNGIAKEVSTLYVCCDNGQSRSSAVGAAFLRYMGESDIKIWNNPKYNPNTLVYKMLCSALEIKASPLRMHILKYVNERALKKEIEKHRQG